MHPFLVLLQYLMYCYCWLVKNPIVYLVCVLKFVDVHTFLQAP